MAPPYVCILALLVTLAVAEPVEFTSAGDYLAEYVPQDVLDSLVKEGAAVKWKGVAAKKYLEGGTLYLADDFESIRIVTATKASVCY
jgi:hypothetical protein